MPGPVLLRGTVMHVPRDPFREGGALEAFEDGGVLIASGEVGAIGDFGELLIRHPEAVVDDRSGAILLPGLVDAHVHYPQVPAIGALGMRLLEWLERRALPEEARYSDVGYAADRADVFLRLLAANGTTTAMVFGAHFAQAMDAFFAAAERSGLRIIAGLNVSDGNLGEALHASPEQALAQGLELAGRWHGRGRLAYAVTPRFALSCSEAMLASCGELLSALPGLYVTSHLNENPDEIARVREAHPAARDYLDAYDRFGLIGERTVLAHDVHPSHRELARLADAGAAVAHCPSSNLTLGSGLFPLTRHHQAGVRVALGSDVGAGVGFGLLKEALTAHQVQMLRADGELLDPARALYLATGAGARALGMVEAVGDLTPGKQADLVIVRPPPGSTLAELLRFADDARSALSAVLALAREESIEEVLVGGERVHRRLGGTAGIGHAGSGESGGGLDAGAPAGP